MYLILWFIDSVLWGFFIVFDVGGWGQGVILLLGLFVHLVFVSLDLEIIPLQMYWWRSSRECELVQ